MVKVVSGKCLIGQISWGKLDWGEVNWGRCPVPIPIILTIAAVDSANKNLKTDFTWIKRTMVGNIANFTLQIPEEK